MINGYLDRNNIINQRGQTIYRQTDSRYVFDMCFLQWGGGGMPVTYLLDEGVKIINEGENTMFVNMVFPIDVNLEQGKSYTLSVDVQDLRGHWYLRFIQSDVSISGIELSDIRHKISEPGICHLTVYPIKSAFSSLIIGCDGRQSDPFMAGNFIKFGKVKTEQGPISTLINDVPEDKASRLLKCQRYYERIGYGVNAKISGTSARPFITISHKFAVEKRITPTIKLIKQPQFYNSNVGPILPNNTVIDSLAVDAKAIHYVDLAGFINPLDPSTPYPCHCDTQDFLEISAEL